MFTARRDGPYNVSGIYHNIMRAYIKHRAGRDVMTHRRPPPRARRVSLRSPWLKRASRTPCRRRRRGPPTLAACLSDAARALHARTHACTSPRPDIMDPGRESPPWPDHSAVRCFSRKPLSRFSPVTHHLHPRWPTSRRRLTACGFLAEPRNCFTAAPYCVRVHASSPQVR